MYYPGDCCKYVQICLLMKGTRDWCRISPIYIRDKSTANIIMMDTFAVIALGSICAHSMSSRLMSNVNRGAVHNVHLSYHGIITRRISNVPRTIVSISISLLPSCIALVFQRSNVF